VLFVAVVWWCARKLLPQQPQEATSPVSEWPGVEAVAKETQEYEQLEREFQAGCEPHAEKYDFRLEVEAIYRVSHARGANAPADALARTPDGRRLFHGTRRPFAHAIVQGGFRLPEKKGMFGKGIYFADCPLKSFQYTDGKTSTDHRGILLLNWVELGRQNHQKEANSNLTRPPHRSFMQWVKRENKYESVVGDDHHAGGALRVPEYIVYNAEKVEVDYIFEAKSTPARHNGV